MNGYICTTTKTIRYIKTENSMIGYIILITMVITIVAFIILIFLSTRSSNKELDEFKKAISKISSKAEYTKSKTVMENSIFEIKEYYVMSKKFANRSFLLAILSCIIGIICIIIAVIIFFIMDTLTYLPMISAAILEIIGATSLFVFKNTQNNLHLYFNALHENEQLLTIIELVENINSVEKKDLAYLNIINHKLEKYK